MASASLERAYGENEPDYFGPEVKEMNPEYDQAVISNGRCIMMY